MTRLVLDSSVIVKWIADEPGSDAARRLRDEDVVVPPLVFLEVMNVAGRKWGWREPELLALGRQLQDARLDVANPSLDLVASWIARGLSAYDAAYLAVAEELDLPLVTTDIEILDLASEIARPLAG